MTLSPGTLALRAGNDRLAASLGIDPQVERVTRAAMALVQVARRMQGPDDEARLVEAGYAVQRAEGRR